MGRCSVCENEFEDEYFDTDQQKCILHSRKISSFHTDDEKAKSFYHALINYIATQTFQLNKEANVPFQPEKTKIINFLANLDNDTSISITSALQCKIILKDIIFPSNCTLNSEYNYVNILNKLITIAFKNCHFEDDLKLDKNKNLKFRKCTFTGEWLHVFCHEIEYLECKFEDFVIDNPSEDKFIVENHLFYNCGFRNIRCSGTRFEKRFFKFNNINQYKKIEKIELTYCEFNEDFILTITDNEDKEDKEYFNITSINLEHSIFNGKVKIQFCEIEEEARFYNTKFKDLADFYRTKFNEVIFERTDFEKVAVFSEAVFNQNVNFKYAKFLGYSVFRDTVIKGKLDLRNTIFDTDADANFLDITSEERARDNETKEFYGEPKVIQVANRETARIIKSFYEYTNNIIEANKFYALEMKEREKELSKTINSQNFIDLIIFKLHGLSSNHSQDPIAPVLWILNIAFIYSMFTSTLYLDIVLANIAIFTILISVGMYMFVKNNIINKVILIGNLLMPIFLSYITFATIADKINPFSIMTSKDPVTFGLLIFKITIAYLIYQFIVSIRQNTRRK